MRRTVKALGVNTAPTNLIGSALRSVKNEMKELLQGDAGRDEAKMQRLANDIIEYQRALDILHGYVVTQESDASR